ncbi:MAG: sigma-54 dependent transcriptional regulator [Candidatus Hydrogenedentes bacterium]|nr:sigma-54 dependent transcriptional regulator [Candidatus Hydrogenedentota bacterium]
MSLSGITLYYAQQTVARVEGRHRGATFKRIYSIVMSQMTETCFGKMLGLSPVMQDVYEAIDKAAGVDIPVLIVGETGTGKELVAQEIHARSARQHKPFVAVNTGALTSELVASELFGHAKGAFTGTTGSKEGRFREAHGGVLFLDEVTTMQERVQVALLRVLESGSLRPVGASDDVTVDVRVIAATNEPLENTVAKGRFRADLHHRLGVFPIVLPPLKERTIDIPVLVEAFLSESNADFHANVSHVEDRAIEALMSYSWPGNVRELRNVIARAVIVAESGKITIEHLPRRIVDGAAVPGEQHQVLPFAAHADEDAIVSAERSEEGEAASAASFFVTDGGVFLPFGASWEDVERFFGLKTLEFCGSNKTRAAEMLGVSRKTLYDKLRRWESAPGEPVAASQAIATKRPR